MKNVSIPTLALAWMIAMVYAASTTLNYKDLAHLIHEEANYEIKHVRQNETVPKISTTHGTTCVKEFFCLAEMALNKTRLKHSKLNHLLHQFNNKTKAVCWPNHLSGTKSLRRFLNEIKNCTEHKPNRK